MKINSFKIKAILLLVFVGLAIFIFTGHNQIVQTTKADIDGPPAARTGAPGELTCTECHNNTAGVGQMSIVTPANYTPGQTYTIQVMHTTTDTTRRRWGFELTALANNVMAGTLASTTSFTRTRVGGGKTYIEQIALGTFQNQTGGATWSFNWTAPATNVGPVTFYAAGLQSNNNGSESGDRTITTNATIQPAPVVAPTHTVSDFDGDGKTDPAILRNDNNNAVWYARTPSSVITQQFGLMSDKFAPADFDGDGKTDPAVFRNGAWWILKSSTGTITAEQFGAGGDIPVIGDYDGDGKGDMAVFRQGIWYWKGSSDNVMRAQQWGISTDKPVSGDYDGDGKSDLAVYRGTTSDWWVYQSSNGTVISVHHGLPGDIPVPGDYDGDRRTNIAVWRRTQGAWYTSTDVNNNYYGVIYWGISTDVPVPGDYDGDGKTDAAIYRNGTWYIRMSSTTGLSVQTFGAGSDTAVPNLYIQ